MLHVKSNKPSSYWHILIGILMKNIPDMNKYKQDHKIRTFKSIDLVLFNNLFFDVVGPTGL